PISSRSSAVASIGNVGRGPSSRARKYRLSEVPAIGNLMVTYNRDLVKRRRKHPSFRRLTRRNCDSDSTTIPRPSSVSPPPSQLRRSPPRSRPIASAAQQPARQRPLSASRGDANPTLPQPSNLTTRAATPNPTLPQHNNLTTRAATSNPTLPQHNNLTHPCTA